MVREDKPGEFRLTRTIWFSRLDLQLARQIDSSTTPAISSPTPGTPNGAPTTTSTFPKHIEINRPRDEYGVVIDVVKMDINKGVSDDKFVLKQPPGSTLQVVGQPPAPASDPTGKPKEKTQ